MAQDLETLTTLTLVGEILTGLGLLGFLLGYILDLFAKPAPGKMMNLSNAIWGIALSGASFIAYVYGLLAFIDEMTYHTAYNAFRAWKINFMVIWISVGLSVLSSVGFIAGMNFGLMNLLLFVIPLVFVGAGAFFMWYMKQLWIMEDPERSLAGYFFDYFGKPDYDPHEGEEEHEEDADIDETTEEAKHGDATTDQTEPHSEATEDAKEAETSIETNNTPATETSTTTETKTTDTTPVAPTNETTTTTEPTPTARRRRRFAGSIAGLKDLAIAF